MDIGFLFGWAKEQGVDLPTKADGSINIPAAFALYDEWKKKGGGGKAKGDNGGTDSKGGGKEDAPDVVELDENSELMKRVEGLSPNEREKAVRKYLQEVLTGKVLYFHDGVVATVSGNDRRELAHDTFHTEKGLRRTAELAEIENLIKNARHEKEGAVENHNKEKFSMFRYYTVTTRYKGNEQTLRLNVGKSIHTGKYQLYAITVKK